jgi:hypothetical protein
MLAKRQQKEAGSQSLPEVFLSQFLAPAAAAP